MEPLKPLGSSRCMTAFRTRRCSLTLNKLGLCDYENTETFWFSIFLREMLILLGRIFWFSFLGKKTFIKAFSTVSPSGNYHSTYLQTRIVSTKIYTQYFKFITPIFIGSAVKTPPRQSDEYESYRAQCTFLFKRLIAYF